MHFRTIASIAVLACASNAAAEPQPYKLAMMPVPGMSLMRRDTSGYQPEQTICGAGETCDQACGAGYTQCPSEDKSVHCFNPQAAQSCCSDGTGNSCDAGYYCTHDTKSQTWCCPESMDLTACAKAYGVKDGLKSDQYTTSTPTSTSTSSTPTSTSTTAESTTSAYAVTTTSSTTSHCPTSSGYTTAWSAANSTITTYAPTKPTQPTGGSPPAHSSPATLPSGSSGAGANSVSALLLAAVGVLAFL